MLNFVLYRCPSLADKGDVVVDRADNLHLLCHAPHHLLAVVVLHHHLLRGWLVFHDLLCE